MRLIRGGSVRFGLIGFQSDVSLNVFQFLKIWIWVWSGVLCDIFWLGLIRFIAELLHRVTHRYWCQAQKQPSSTPPHSDSEKVKHLQDFGFVGVGSVPQYKAIGRLLGGPRADWSSWGEEGGAWLGRYQLIGPSVSPSLSDSSCISSVFPESLLAVELMEGEFLKEWDIVRSHIIW